MNLTDADIRHALATVIDPELGLNIVDLGLIYRIDLEPGRIRVTMTMTSAACPMHNLLSRMAEDAILDKAGSGVDVSVDLVFDPPWTPSMMSETARRILG